MELTADSQCVQFRILLILRMLEEYKTAIMLHNTIHLRLKFVLLKE